MHTTSVEETVQECLTKFLRGLGREVPPLVDSLDLVDGTGCSSDEGIDFVLDLCDVFNFDFPHDFNPFVHDSGRRGRRLGELVKAIESFLGDGKRP